MQYDALAFGWQTNNGTAASIGNQAIDSYITTYAVSIKPPSSSISAVRFIGLISGTLTNSAQKCFIVEGILGKLYQTVTVSTTADTLTLASNHNISVNDKIMIFGATMPTGITRSGVYWVVNVNGNDIQISTTQGGTAFDFTDTGTNVAVAKYVDHSELTSTTNIESTRYWIDYNGFNAVSLSNDKIYYLMVLTTEAAPSTNKIVYYYLNNYNVWNILQFTINISSLTRSYTSSRLQHRITYANGFVDDFLFGYGQNGNSIAYGTVKIGNYYKNNTETKLYIRNVVANMYAAYNAATFKDATYVCRIYNRATRDLLATSIPLNLYSYCTANATSQYALFEFSDAYEWAVNSEIYVVVEVYSGTTNASNTICIYQTQWNATYYNGVNALFKRRGRTDALLFQVGVQYSSGTWAEQTGANATMYFLELQFDTFKPTGSTGGTYVEPITIF